MNSRIIYDKMFSCPRPKRPRRTKKNIEKFEIQIIRKWRERESEELVNRLESNSIKEINLIGFRTFPIFRRKKNVLSFQTLLQEMKSVLSHCYDE